MARVAPSMAVVTALGMVVLAGCVLSGAALLAFLWWHSPISRVLARPGVAYRVGPVAHRVPPLDFGRQATYLVRAPVLARMRILLDYTHRLLTAHGVTYWITNGTLLGAVRHGGFIPWDDDIDVHVLLRDLSRLRALAPQVERDGFVLLEAAGGLKLAYRDRHRYPYVDLVVVAPRDGRFQLCFPLDGAGRPTFRKAAQWPNECLRIADVAAPAAMPFEDFEVRAPREAEQAVRSIYGDGALGAVRHRRWARLENHFAMMTCYRLGLSRG